LSSASARGVPIAIVGIGCRFPGGVIDAASLWRLLITDTSAITEIPANRIDLTRYYDERPATPGRMMTRWGGFVDGIENFDADFFGISPREAEVLDPQQRLLLETAWEALEDAGQEVHRLKGAQVGVFVGQWLSDFESRLFADPEVAAFYMTTGSGRYAASGRLSYVLGLRGPSLTLDTACSSSLVAVHLAVRSIRNGESEMALAGGVNVILQPQISIAYSQSLMMAPDGRCKFGDQLGDGYVRSDGAGLVVLKSLQRALADGDRIYAVIRGSSTNNDGNSSGSMGTPSRLGQEELLRSAYRDAGRAANEVGYIEAHGTGTRAGDPIELGALGSVLGEGRPEGQKVFVGSIKTNLGHTEGAAGIAGLIKAALVLHHGRIPASLNCNTLNPAVDWANTPLEIVRQSTSWVGEKRLAGVSAFGIAGSNAHVVLESTPAKVAIAQAPSTKAASSVVPLLPLSARSEAALRILARKVADLLAAPNAPAISDLLRFAQTRRAAFEHRVAFLAIDAEELAVALKTYADGGEPMAQGVIDPRHETKVALVFPGQGGQWNGMARALLEKEPAFRESIERADAVIRREAGWSLIEQLALSPGDAGYLGDRIDVVQPTLGALAIAYADWMKAAGLTADSVIGHSMGEAAAAHVAGALSLDDALRILCRRSVLMRNLSGAGAMALVDLSAEDVSAELFGLEDKASIAAVNSRRSTVISGEKECITELVAAFNARGVFSRLVNVDVASHSPQMEQPSKALRENLSGITPHAASTEFASALFGRMLTGEKLDATYWARNLREPVQFAKALEALVAREVEVFLELGPHPVLSPSIEQVETGSGRHPTVVCCGRREGHERELLVGALGALWCAGAPVDFARGATSPAAVIDFPHYPWTRRRHWVDLADISRTNVLRTAKRGPDAEAKEWMFHTVWRELSPPQTIGASAGDWLLIGADEPLAAALERAGASMESAPLADLEERLSKLDAAEAPNVLVVAPAGEATAFLPLRVAKGLKPGATARLWFITRGAQSTEARTRLNVDHAALWGAARVLSDERPDLWGGLLDLSPMASAADVSAAAAWLLDPQGEDLAAVYNGGVYVPRLAPITETHGSRLGWRADSSYLLTGGLGDVGLAVARAMVEEGARRLILMSRSGLPSRRTWADIDPATPVGKRIAAVRAMESLGASIQYPAVDVADEKAVAAFLAEYSAEGWPPIRGVIHLAGVLDRRLIDETSQAQFESAAAGKLRGAQVLDRLLPDLDCFVLFSSTTTVLPQTGIAAYVAANAGLEGLALDRRARGLPAIAIAWGQWRAGMLADDSGQAIIAEQAQRGVGSFTTERGADILSWAAAQPNPVIVVAPIDWQTYSKARAGRNEPLLKELKRPVADKAVDDRAHAGPQAFEDVFALVREAVARTLQFSINEIDPTKEFGAMGLTSLLALELRNRLERALGRPLSATLAWNFPTVETLSAHLSGAVKPRPWLLKDRTPPAKNAESLTAKVAPMAELSDADALLALRRRRKDVLS
jgi:phthiocerol/phenolphthiocerol synthesis type-I polyketide synthase B